MARPLHVLYVDDYEPMGELVGDLLGAEGFRVTVMADPLQALESTGGFDVAVVDLNMPGMNGDEFCRRFRARTGRPVVVVSGQVDEAHRRRAIEAGAHAVIDKKDVMARLADIVRSAEPAA